MRYKLLIIATLVLLTFGLIVWDRTNITQDDVLEPVHTLQIVPDVNFALLDGGSVSLHSLKGHTVLLHFWASWCAPCREEFPALLEHMQKNNDNTILLTVSGDAKAEDAQRFLAPFKDQFKSLFDNGKVLIAHDPHHELIEGKFLTFRYPETIVISPDLEMQRKMVGTYTE